MSPKHIQSRDVPVPPLVGARFIVPSLDFARGNRATRFSKAERKVQTVLQDFSYCWLSAVSCRLCAINSARALLTIHYSHFSIHHAPERCERLPRERIPRLYFEGLLKTLHRARVHFLAEIRAAQIVVWKMARLITARFNGALEPRYRFIKSAQLDQIRADVVVRIAKLRIDFYRALAFSNGVFDAALKMICPAEKRVGLGSGVQFERGLIELDGPVVVALHLGLVSVLQDFPRPRQGFLAHGLNC